MVTICIVDQGYHTVCVDKCPDCHGTRMIQVRHWTTPKRRCLRPCYRCDPRYHRVLT